MHKPYKRDVFDYLLAAFLSVILGALLAAIIYVVYSVYLSSPKVVVSSSEVYPQESSGTLNRSNAAINYLPERGGQNGDH